MVTGNNTKLQIIAVMFTFSFSTSFAADLTLDDYNKALTAEKANQVTYMQNAKTQAINGFKQDKDGNYDVNGTKYAKAALEAAADKAIADATVAMDKVINDALNGKTFTDDESTGLPAEVKNVQNAATVNTADAMAKAIAEDTTTLNKVQAPIAKAAAEAAVAKVDASAYPADDEAYTIKVGEKDVKVSSAEYVQIQIDAAKKAIADASVEKDDDGKDVDDATKIQNYGKIAEALAEAIKDVKTKEDVAIEGSEAVKTVEQAINVYVADGYGEGIFNVKGTFPTSLPDVDFDKFYVEAKAPKKATLFGVEIADVTKITKAEAVAVNDAAYATLNGIKPTIKTYANGSLDKMDDLKGGWAEVYRFTTAADVYEQVKAEGEKMKAETNLGIKVYDDAAVDKEVAAAETKVIDDISNKDGFKAPKAYIDAEKCGNKSFDIKKFEKAQEDAAGKFIDKIVTVGSNPTAEADKVYAAELYADSDAYKAVKDEALKAIADAQSYADIDKALEDAKTELGKLMLADDKDTVLAAREAYESSLDGYAKQVAALGKEGISEKTYSAAVKQGKALIEKANSVDAVKEAYAEAQKIVDSVKTDKELEAAAKAVIDAANALPYTSTLTAADEATVEAVVDAYKAFLETPGAEPDAVENVPTIVAPKLDKVYTEKAKALEEEAKAVVEAEKAAPNGDAGVEALSALKEKAQAVADAKAALAKEVADGIKVLGKDTLKTDVTDAEVYPNIEKVTKEKGILEECANAEVTDAYNKMIMAAKPDATQAQIDAAAAAYNKLSEKQKAELKGEDAYDAITGEIIESVLAKAEAGFDAEAVKAALQDMSIVARSTKLSSGKIKVTVKADVQEIVDNGYTVKYKFFVSTKSSKKGYTSKIEKTTKSFTTSGTKGKTNYWKVTVKVFDAEGNLVAKTPLTQCRYACRTL